MQWKKDPPKASLLARLWTLREELFIGRSIASRNGPQALQPEPIVALSADKG